MIGIVIVSHSAKLAEGAADLARSMGGSEVPIAAAGGLDMPDSPLGTDPLRVLAAIEQIYSDDGVLVLVDLGSGMLSADMALDMLLPEQRAHVLLCDAPLVEGAVVAAAQARLGNSLEQVAAEARNALSSKIAHVGAQPLPAAESAPIHAGDHKLTLVVQNPVGLHARPAARFVQTAGRFQSDIFLRDLTTQRGPISARSINAVITLGVRQYDEIEVTASGDDAALALDALRQLAEDHFGDRDPISAPPRSDGSKIPIPPEGLRGLPASPGIAVGPVVRFRSAVLQIPTELSADPQVEYNALLTALDKTRSEIRATYTAVRHKIDASAADVFTAHSLLLDDPVLLDAARDLILRDSLNAAAAWDKAVAGMVNDYQAADNAYIRARSADLSAVSQQVIRHLLNQPSASSALTEPGILVAADLTPADTAGLNPAYVLGICTAGGSPTSHSAILARALGIPVVVGLGESILSIADGTLIAIDGEAGTVIPNPDSEILRQYAKRRETQQAQQREARQSSAAPAITRDGRHIHVLANIGSAADAEAAVSAGAEGVGLFRTEFVFLNRQTAPDEEEQFTAYRSAAAVLAGRPLTIRTLDVGGDKPLPYIDLGAEANPFLGVRAIRLCLERPDLFKTQLRAMWCTAAEFPVKIMFPMIATLPEIRAAKVLLTEARAELQSRGVAVPDQIETGMMVEIPAAALLADRFAAEVDFFSIGTNDLTQYTFAAERGNPRLAALTDGLQPAILQLIERVVEAAHARGKRVAVCGELASDVQAVPLLVGLGVDELSMNAAAIPAAKQVIRTLDTASAAATAQIAVTLDTPDAVRAMLGRS